MPFPRPRLPRSRRLLVLAAGALLLLVAGAAAALLARPAPAELTLSELRAAVAADEVVAVELDDARRRATVELADGGERRLVYPAEYGPVLTRDLLSRGVEVTATPPASPQTLVTTFGPVLLILAALAWWMHTGGGKVKMKGGRGRAADIPETRFADVAGQDEVVEELRELVDWLHDPERAQRLGGRPPGGVLFTGPPGTGKTLLARALAGEAGVPFYAMSGSDFIEVFAGVGAARVRSLFGTARKAGTAVIFIDELDAVGRRRASANMDGQRENDQTLNQLLVEMDGFTGPSGVLVIAATNRIDVLDPALTRAGRFDRHITIGYPDRGGRRRILQLHSAELPLADDVDLDLVAGQTAGLVGADLASLCSQASSAAARERAEHITTTHFQQALTRLLVGPERRSVEVVSADRRTTAWHEAGHAVAALLHPHAEDPVRVSIIPHGEAGGVTIMGVGERTLISAAAASARLVTSMAGRAAELLAFGPLYTNGASGDMRAATDLATRMAADFGMTTEIGPVHLPEDRRVGAAAERLDTAVRRLVEEALTEATALLDANRRVLDAVAERLLDEDQLSLVQLREIATEVGVVDVPWPAGGDEDVVGIGGLAAVEPTLPPASPPPARRSAPGSATA